jgi:hypothetical protein
MLRLRYNNAELRSYVWLSSDDQTSSLKKHHCPLPFPKPRTFAQHPPLFCQPCCESPPKFTFLVSKRKVDMVLKRREICELLGFNSWTAVQVWLADVVSPAFTELIRDYLQPFADQGLRNPTGTSDIKELFVLSANDLDQVVERRVSELAKGMDFHPDKTGCKSHTLRRVSSPRPALCPAH